MMTTQRHDIDKAWYNTIRGWLLSAEVFGCDVVIQLGSGVKPDILLMVEDEIDMLKLHDMFQTGMRGRVQTLWIQPPEEEFIGMLVHDVTAGWSVLFMMSSAAIEALIPGDVELLVGLFDERLLADGQDCHTFPMGARNSGTLDAVPAGGVDA